MFKVVTIYFVIASLFFLLMRANIREPYRMSSFRWCRLTSGSPPFAMTLKAHACDPQLALPVAEVVQRKMSEAGSRGLNLSKCRILIHPDSADLVVWPSTLPHPTHPLLPVVSTGMKLLGAPIGPEIFHQEFVETKVTASVPYLKKLWAAWSLLRYCVNERINYQAQVTEFPLVQDSLALMDEIIDNAILRAGGLPIASPDSLTHLTTCTLLRFLPCDLGKLGIRRFARSRKSGLDWGGWLFRPESDFDRGADSLWPQHYGCVSGFLPRY